MRFFATVPLALVLLASRAQHPSIATLLSLTDCLDTTCVSERVRPMGYCLKGGEEEDGWMWFTCQSLDSLKDYDLLVTLGFFGYAISNYRDYIIGTGDTAVAATLTEELFRLGFTMGTPLGAEGHVYRNNAYPTLEVHRLEKRYVSVEFKQKADPIDPHAETLGTNGCDDSETLKEAKKLGYDRVERIHKLHWVFKVRVPTPHLMVRQGERYGTVILYYPVTDPVQEFVVRDPSGKEVLSSMTQGMRTVIDLSNQPNGAYFLTIRTAAGDVSTTFMKE